MRDLSWICAAPVRVPLVHSVFQPRLSHIRLAKSGHRNSSTSIVGKPSTIPSKDPKRLENSNEVFLSLGIVFPTHGPAV
jgi:hypothetical protein